MLMHWATILSVDICHFCSFPVTPSLQIFPDWTSSVCSSSMGPLFYNLTVQCLLSIRWCHTSTPPALMIFVRFVCLQKVLDNKTPTASSVKCQRSSCSLTFVCMVRCSLPSRLLVGVWAYVDASHPNSTPQSSGHMKTIQGSALVQNVIVYL